MEKNILYVFLNEMNIYTGLLQVNLTPSHILNSAHTHDQTNIKLIHTH